MTKVDLITGLLGSGKTTFLFGYARYLISKGLRIAVLVNDLGAVNVDMLLLQELKGENCQLEMVSGGCDQHCHRRRFRTQLIALGMQHFDRVIIEPSGIFDMDEFFDVIRDEPLDRWFETGSILTVIEAGSEQHTDQMEYLFASEAACCGRLILSKSAGSAGEVEEAIDRLNSALESIGCTRRFASDDMLAKEWKTLTADDYEGLMSAGYKLSSYVKKYSPDELLSGVHYFMRLSVPEESIQPLIGSVFSDPECGRVYRIKGALPVENGWLKINATPGECELLPVSDGQAVLIVIGDHVSAEAVDRHIRPLNGSPDYVFI